MSDGGGLDSGTLGGLPRDDGDGGFRACAAWSSGDDAFGRGLADVAVGIDEGVDFLAAARLETLATGEVSRFVLVPGWLNARVADRVHIAPGGISALSVETLRDGNVLGGDDEDGDRGGGGNGGASATVRVDVTG